MTRYVLQRLFHSFLLVLGLLTVVFFLVRLMPGDPVLLIGEQHLTAEGGDLVRRRLGLEGSLASQYARWLGGALTGDFGESLRQQRPVTDVLAEAIPSTLLLTVGALLLELGVGLAVGLHTARHPRSRRARALSAAGLVLYSLPGFWLGLVAIMVFARDLGWLPAGGMHSPDAALLSPAAATLDTMRHLVLPVAVLGLGNVAVTARFMRATLGGILASEWVLALRARGLGEAAVVRHALRASLPSLITLVGMSLPGLLGGAVVVEEVFAWPGMGRVAVQALLARDYPVIMAVTAMVAVLVTLGSLAADVGCRLVDPRLRLDAADSEVG